MLIKKTIVSGSVLIRLPVATAMFLKDVIAYTELEDAELNAVWDELESKFAAIGEAASHDEENAVLTEHLNLLWKSVKEKYNV